jgi:anti-sigma28 factor (negative regulator of flagellin synthesis)
LVEKARIATSITRNSVMKINEKIRSDALLQQEIARKRVAARNEEGVEQGRSGSESVNSEIQVNVSLGSSLNKLIDMETVALERSEKIQKIKESVQSGKYFQDRPVSLIAQALAEGISEEIDIQRIILRPEREEELE